MRLVALVLSTLLGSGPAVAETCSGDPAFAAAAAENATSVTGSSWTFTEGRDGAPEGPGWAVYAPLTAATIGTACGPDTEVFAAKLGPGRKAMG